MFFPTDAGDRLLANLHSGTPSLCAYVFSHPNLVEVAGFAGIDCFMADMMFTALDWADIAALIRAARGTGISPLIRVQAYPWSDGIDQRTVSDAARALALGATAVTISIASCAQMQALLRLRSDWHRLIHVRRFPTAADFPDFAHRVAQETLIVPTIESEGGLRDLEAIFALDGVQLVWLAAGDLSKLLGVPFQYEHPTMLALLERAVRLGERYGAGARLSHKNFTCLSNASNLLGQSAKSSSAS
jgi:4-hydroxy-2-oxoheptanedioate aldolase